MYKLPGHYFEHVVERMYAMCAGEVNLYLGVASDLAKSIENSYSGKILEHHPDWDDLKKRVIKFYKTRFKSFRRKFTRRVRANGVRFSLLEPNIHKSS